MGTVAERIFPLIEQTANERAVRGPGPVHPKNLQAGKEGEDYEEGAEKRRTVGHRISDTKEVSARNRWLRG